MNIIDYIDSYQDKTFKEVEFNELDAAIFSLLSYFPFYLINGKKGNYKNKEILKFVDSYVPEENIPEHRILHIQLMGKVIRSIRYKGIKFIHFRRKRSDSSIEQFQAISILLKKFMYVSFSGTDATTLGWREDFNMAFLDIVPSEVDAIKYINDVRRRHRFKPMYIGGHSKGGRLAIRAGKEIYKNNTVLSIFSFDGPNFSSSFYDDKYEEMKHLIYEYAPTESVIGRLISHKDKIIVESNASLLFQHSLYTWLIEETQFVHADKYTDRSNKIARICDEVFTKYDNETKSVFVNTFFDLFEKLNITELKDTEYNKQLVINSLHSFRIEWKGVPRDTRKIILKILFTILLLSIKRR